MKITRLFILLFILSMLVNLPSFAQALDTTSTDSSTAGRRQSLGCGFGANLNTIFQSSDFYSMPRLYFSILPSKQRFHLELEYGFKSTDLYETGAYVNINSAGRLDTFLVSSETNTNVTRYSFGIFTSGEVYPNLMRTIGIRAGRIIATSNKQNQRMVSRELFDSEFFIEPTLGLEYLVVPQFGLSLQLGYTVKMDGFLKILDADEIVSTGDSTLPLSIEPITNRMNVSLNAYVYFGKR